MRKMYRSLAFCAIPLFCVISLCLALIFTGKATPFITCFAVDSFDRIYIGTQNEIRVYTDDVLMNTINPQTSRAYIFTINKDDNILLSTSTKIYTMDLNGTVLNVGEDAGANMYNQIQYSKRNYTSSKGDEYKLVSAMGWTHITRNNADVVYQISPLSFLVKILLYISSIASFVFPVLVIIRKTKEDSLFGYRQKTT